jgi:UDP-N-acetylglucosamine 2-epimerase (non-hydrolysing)
MKVINVVGARPNFMKVAPIFEIMQRLKPRFEPLLVHTGQHYDARMSDTFFTDLQLPDPDIHLEVGSASHAVQTAAVMERFEPVVLDVKPDWVVVVGDVNSTLACALVCSKLGVRVAHVEAGLRSRDRSMPEEINRLLTDQIADLLLTPSQDADANLLAEGIPQERIRFVGNVMIDSLIKCLKAAERSNVREQLKVNEGEYGVVTLHRPSNVDYPDILSGILDALDAISENIPLIFPIHPRTRESIARFGLQDRVEAIKNLQIIEPLGYMDFLRLYSGAGLVLTDSGGIQEETTFLGIPCLTLRKSTERPITIEMGTNRLVGSDTAEILMAASEALTGKTVANRQIPPLWDGHTAERIVRALEEA